MVRVHACGNKMRHEILVWDIETYQHIREWPSLFCNIKSSVRNTIILSVKVSKLLIHRRWVHAMPFGWSDVQNHIVVRHNLKWRCSWDLTYLRRIGRPSTSLIWSQMEECWLSNKRRSAASCLEIWSKVVTMVSNGIAQSSFATLAQLCSL